MSAVDSAILEIDAHLAALAPTHEGLRDYTKLNLQSETQAVVRSTLLLYDRRVALLTAARNALVLVQADAYPSLESPDVSAAIYRDLKANADTIAAALATFDQPAGAALLGLKAGEAVKK